MAVPVSWSRAMKFFNYMQRGRPSYNYLCLNQADRQYSFPRSCIGQCNMYARDVKGEQSAMGQGPGLNPKKKKVFIPRVTLLMENDEMSVVTMETANKIASRRNLKLVKIVDFDTKTERPTYKLMSSRDYIQEGMLRKTHKKVQKETSLKPEKMVSLSTKINEHDLQTKLKNIVKFLTKRHEVRFVITLAENAEKSAEICTQLETVLKDVPVTIRKSKSDEKIKFHLCPIIEEKAPDQSEINEKMTEVETPVATGS